MCSQPPLLSAMVVAVANLSAAPLLGWGGGGIHEQGGPDGDMGGRGNNDRKEGPYEELNEGGRGPAGHERQNAGMGATGDNNRKDEPGEEPNRRGKGPAEKSEEGGGGNQGGRGKKQEGAPAVDMELLRLALPLLVVEWGYWTSGKEGGGGEAAGGGVGLLNLR